MKQERCVSWGVDGGAGRNAGEGKTRKHGAHQDRLFCPPFLRPQGAGPRAPDPGSHGTTPTACLTVLGPRRSSQRGSGGAPGGEENLFPRGWEVGCAVVAHPLSPQRDAGPPRERTPSPKPSPRPPGRWAPPERSFPSPPGPPRPGSALTGRGSRRLRRTLRYSTSEVAAGAAAPVLEPQEAAGAALASRRSARRATGSAASAARVQPRSRRRVAALALVLEHQTQALHAALRACRRCRGPRLAAHPTGRRGRAEAVGSGPEPRSRAERRRRHGRQAHAEGPRARRALPGGASARRRACRFNKPSWRRRGAGTAHPRRTPIGRLGAPRRADWL